MQLLQILAFFQIRVFYGQLRISNENALINGFWSDAVIFQGNNW
jgi:hypothetical protein